MIAVSPKETTENIQKAGVLILIGLISLILSVIFLIHHYELRVYFNVTSSLPYTLFLHVKQKENGLNKGNFVVFYHSSFGAQPLIKQITGIPGEPIDLYRGILRNQEQLFPLQKETSTGIPLTPLSSGIIPKDHYFLSGTHFRSFDSRYQSFGLIYVNNIKERVWPLF